MPATADEVKALLGPLPLAAPDALWESVHAVYGSTPRVYHTFAHVAEVASQYRLVAKAVTWQRPDEVCLAVLYHDAIYRVGSKSNERDSAALARADLARWLPSVDAEYTASLIELTARHGALRAADLDSDADAALFLDCDMAILGARPDAYDRYAAQVADEYAPVIPPRVYEEGRRQFLDKLLSAEQIFLSPFFHARLDEQARDNLHRERARFAPATS